MKTLVKIPRRLFEHAKEDLSRPHAFACERVGFFSTRRSVTDSGTLVHCIAYHAVADEHYVEDDSVGARIGSRAITDAMTRAMTDSVGQLHVHRHGGRGLPRPSFTDDDELSPLARSFVNANRSEASGWMILGDNDAYTRLTMPPHSEVVVACPVTIVGAPVIVNRRNTQPGLSGFIGKLIGKRRAAGNRRYARQSFLGSDSESIIANAVVGIVGLGGGGSHIVQQLAHLGFKRFILCDHDRISNSNLNRLVGATCADVRAKRLKADIASRTILKLHRDAHINAPGHKWEDMIDDLLTCDVVVGCVDTFATRRDVEAFCRQHMIPYVDVGMDVHSMATGQFEIDGQVILSLPGEPCMHCMGFLNEIVLSQEAAKYGAAGDNPQVVWSNGLLCSAAVGIVVDLLTDWSKTLRGPRYLALQGRALTLQPDKRIAALSGHDCKHYPLTQIGDPLFTAL